ncbi:MAG: YwbE family protein, partial [Nitrosopumilus sp.]|nr:YwbE family protein [Nitrosopumilus sp.]
MQGCTYLVMAVKYNKSISLKEDYFIKQRLRISYLHQKLLNDTPSRNKITIGMMVQIVQKQDQRTGNLTDGKVKRILTSSNFHP